MGRGHGFIPGEVPTRPADKAVRRATLRRVARLFRPYRLRLGALLFLILVSALMGVIPAFLLRRVIDSAHPSPDTKELSLLVGGMIAIPISSRINRGGH